MAGTVDLTGAIFFGLGALLMAALTTWPRLWIAISLNRVQTERGLERHGTTLRILTAAGIFGCLVMVVVSLSGR